MTPKNNGLAGMDFDLPDGLRITIKPAGRGAANCTWQPAAPDAATRKRLEPHIHDAIRAFCAAYGNPAHIHGLAT